MGTSDDNFALPQAKAAPVVPTCCIVLISDQNYMFPTLVSAMQARKNASVMKADVLMCHFGIDMRAEEIFSDICAREGIKLMAVDPETVERANPMMSRLFLNRFMPEQYSQFLYIDGDVHISRSLDPLIEAEVSTGQFLAVNDPMTFLLEDRGFQSRDLSDHMRSIGLNGSEAQRYFNTGVLRINRSGWDDIGQQAWNLSVSNTRKFRFPDQDPLNIVARDCHLPLSLAWNFPVFMRNARVQAQINPCITHFMSNPKPWQGAYPPWNNEACVPYAQAVAQYPLLAPYRQRLTIRRQIHYHLLQNFKKIEETWSWGFSDRRRRILGYEEAALLA